MAGRLPSTGPPTPDFASTPSSSSSKVAIPRLKRDPELAGWGTQASEKHRVSHACEPCRQRKTKCDGGRPCRHCTDFKINCFYGDGKREKAKNEARYLQERVDTYEKTLENIYGSDKVDSQTKQAILEALRESANWEDRIEAKLDSYDKARHEVLAQEGSRVFMRLDKVADDFGGTSDVLHSYLGVSPCLPWPIQTLIGDRASGPEHNPRRIGGSEKGKEAMAYHESGRSGDKALDAANPTSEGFHSYHLDDLAPPISLPRLEDCYELPDRRIVDIFIDAFFSTVHLAFPIVFKPRFLKEYNDYVEHQIQPQPLRTWLASLNVVLAIGSFYTELTDTSLTGGFTHRFFYLRAQTLYFNTEVLFHNPDQRQVQALGILGIYLLTTKQINRCWNVIGLAIRNSYSLGLHLSSDLTRLDRVQQEIRHRKWYALMSLERICGILTGRPTYMDDKRYSIPDLSGINEERLNEILESKNKTVDLDASADDDVDLDTIVKREQELHNIDHQNGFFSQSTKLYTIGLEVLSKIYCAGAVRLTWRHVEDIISSVSLKLERWKIKGGEALFPTLGSPDPDLQVQRKKLLLYLDYLNTVILLNWPCLCRVKAVEAAQSRVFNKTASFECVTAAMDVIKLLPDDIQPTEFWNIFPWWIILYYIVSSGMTVTMEMMMQAEHVPDQKDQLVAAGEKVLRWLNYMGQSDLAAKRSCRMLTELMASAAPHVKQGYQLPPELERNHADPQQQPQEELFTIPEAHPGTLFGSHTSQFAGSPQDQMQGVSPFSGNTAVGAAQLSDLPQHHTLLSVPGIGILARTDLDNHNLLSNYPFQPILEDVTTSVGPSRTVDPMHMQLGHETNPQHLWQWQGYAMQQHHGSGQHTPSQEYPSQMFPTPTFAAPGYIFDGQGEGGYQHSEVEVDSEYRGTPSPGNLHPTDPQYQRGHRRSQ